MRSYGRKGVRLNTYTDSIGRAGARPAGRTSTRLPGTRSNAASRSRNTMQFTHPLSMQVADGCPCGLQFFADLRLGWHRQIQIIRWPGRWFAR